MKVSLKTKLGAIAYDMPRFLLATRPANTGRGPRPWVLLRNRHESLVTDPAKLGAECDWQWTSDLHIARVFPSLGLRFMRRALADWPITLRPGQFRSIDADVRVSFVIGHRGTARLPHLLATLGSIAAQRGTRCECIVVEQAKTPDVKDALPHWVKHLYTPLLYADMPYCRALALNTGARAARGEVLVLHDNDLLVPEDYASEILARIDEGYEVVDLKRFIFYLTEAHTARLFSRRASVVDGTPERVLQNAKGGSLAVTRSAYFAIGGLDEAFVGWGCEDDEFWQRAETRRVWPYGYMPLIHLWHGSPEGKSDHGRLNMELLETRSAIPVEERIRRLANRTGD